MANHWFLVLFFYISIIYTSISLIFYSLIFFLSFLFSLLFFLLNPLIFIFQLYSKWIERKAHKLKLWSGWFNITILAFQFNFCLGIRFLVSRSLIRQNRCSDTRGRQMKNRKELNVSIIVISFLSYTLSLLFTLTNITISIFIAINKSFWQILLSSSYHCHCFMDLIKVPMAIVIIVIYFKQKKFLWHSLFVLSSFSLLAKFVFSLYSKLMRFSHDNDKIASNFSFKWNKKQKNRKKTTKNLYLI